MPRPRDYDALLIDYGGVLTTPMRSWLEESCSAVGVDTDRFLAEVAATSPSPFDLVESGAISRDELAELLTPSLQASAVNGARPEGRSWLTAITISEQHLDQSMIRAVSRLRADGVRVVLLSNSWGADEYPWDLLPTFDATVISGTVGIRKPDPGIYELAVKESGAPPERCVFIDDLALNLIPAADLGIATIHHVDPAETLGKLATYFQLDLRA